MAKKNLDLAPSKRQKKGPGQYVLGFCLLVYTLFCFLPVLLVVIAAFTDEKSITKNGFSFTPEKWSTSGMSAVLKYGKQLAYSYHYCCWNVSWPIFNEYVCIRFKPKELLFKQIFEDLPHYSDAL